MVPQVDTSIAIWIKISPDALIANFLCGSVGSSHIFIPKFRHWIRLISDFCIRFPDHKPYQNSNITTFAESIFNAVTPVQVGVFTCSVYYVRKRDTVQSSEVNDIGKKFVPKQWVSVWFSISVADAIQITLSLFLFTLWIIGRSLVLVLNTVIFKFISGKRSGSQDIVTQLPRWS